MSKVLVTGGTGYIGSHTIVQLLEKGYEVISIDNLSNSKVEVRDSIKKITGKEFQNYNIDLRDSASLNQIIEEHSNIEGVIHFAAVLDVEESVNHPLFYFKNNIIGQLNLLEALKKTQCKSFIFSSSCTVYGEPDEMPVHEAMPAQSVESPYGRTKQIGEGILQDCMRSKEIRNAILLRYFNPAGAHPSAVIGEDPLHLSRHLVPIITHVASGIRQKLMVFGDDYDTRDGSCVRDYIHIMDIARAHILALEWGIQQELTQAEVFNLGTGDGVTVLEMIAAFEKATGISINYEIAARRPGDVSAVYANNSKAKEVLKWSPQYTLEDIMKHAWEWEKVRAAREV